MTFKINKKCKLIIQPLDYMSMRFFIYSFVCNIPHLAFKNSIFFKGNLKKLFMLLIAS